MLVEEDCEKIFIEQEDGPTLFREVMEAMDYIHEKKKTLQDNQCAPISEGINLISVSGSTKTE